MKPLQPLMARGSFATCDVIVRTAHLASQGLVLAAAILDRFIKRTRASRAAAEAERKQEAERETERQMIEAAREAELKKVEAARQADEAEREAARKTEAARVNALPFGILNDDVLMEIVNRLASRDDVRRLACVSRHLRDGIRRCVLASKWPLIEADGNVHEPPTGQFDAVAKRADGWPGVLRAIELAPVGGSVLIERGCYVLKAEWVLSKECYIYGRGQVTLKRSKWNFSTVLTCSSRRGALCGITIAPARAGDVNKSLYGVYISGGIRLQDVTVKKGCAYYGVYVEGTAAKPASPAIVRCVLDGSSLDGSALGYGCIFHSRAQGQLLDSTLTNIDGGGLQVYSEVDDSKSELVVDRNRFENCHVGMDIVDSSHRFVPGRQNIFQNCTKEDNGWISLHRQLEILGCSGPLQHQQLRDRSGSQQSFFSDHDAKKRWTADAELVLKMLGLVMFTSAIFS